MEVKSLIPLKWRLRLAELRGRGPYAAYCDRYRAIFIHVPKTGGRSTAATLFKDRPCLGYHVPYFTYEMANPHKFRRYFKFAFIRKPWDRLVSAYFFLKRADSQRWAGDFVGAYPTFDSFVRGFVSHADITVVRRGHYALLPQSYFLIDGRGQPAVDFLGRYESLDAGFHLVAGRLGLAGAKLPRLNKSEHIDYRTYYTAETQAIVERVYATDIRAFGYRFDQLAPQEGAASMSVARQ